MKEFWNKKSTLHVVIALEGIKIDEIIKQEVALNGVAQQYSPSSIISLAHLFGKINPFDGNLLKCITDGFLNEDQMASKRKAIAEDEAKARENDESGVAPEGVKHLLPLDNGVKAEYNDYTEELYNRFGWATYNGAMTKEEIDDLQSKLHSKTERERLPKVGSAEWTIAVHHTDDGSLKTNNVLVIGKGTAENFTILWVVRFNAQTEGDMEIYEAEVYKGPDSFDHAVAYFEREGNCFDYERHSIKSYSSYRSVGGTRPRSTPPFIPSQSGNQRGGFTQGSGKNQNSLLPVVHTFTDVAKRKQNVLR